MRGFVRFAWLPMIALSLSAAPLSLNTGTNLNWRVSNGIVNLPTAASGTAAVVETGVLPLISAFPAFAGFGWMGSAGQWIGQTATDGNFSCPGCGALPGTYTYSLAWTSAFGGSFTINGFTGDNGVNGNTPVNTSLQVFVNGVAVFSSSAASQNAMSVLAAADGTISNGSGLISYGTGANVVIRAVVANAPIAPGDTTTRSPTGFILYGSGTENDAPGTPEPSTYAMLGLGGAAMLFARLRRK